MADPHHEEVLSGFDRLTVRLYRTALTVAALLLGVLAVLEVLGPDTPTSAVDLAVWQVRMRLVWLALAGATALAVLNLHLYARVLRWAVAAMAWLGVWLLTAAWVWPSSSGLGWRPAWVLGTGFILAVLAALAVKERFCFKIPLLSAMPGLLVVAWAAQASGAYRLSGAVLAVAAAVYLVLVVAKWRMPLHYDIGDKAHYEV